MSQGGFGRDFRRANVLRIQAQEKKDEQERIKTADEVMIKIEGRFQNQIKQANNTIKDATDESLEIVIAKQEEEMKKFLDVIKEKDIMLYVSFSVLAVAAYLFGYYSRILFGL